ncbi:MAG TPA: DNA mismatch repair endonuclease MutL [Tepidiformaceae bacterium]|nr:DNA mismatch repair endonuclease MutL [Tepidiformaceae bacterium]
MTATGGIQVLPPDVAARIAAGEVIERPVSVVRELVDNAIDAGATRVTVEIEDGGLGLIRVLDDGSGIAPGDLEVAFERHATSKLRSAEELRRIRTLGFRGEALPSIAAAGDVEVVSRHHREPVGVAATLVDGRVVRRVSRSVPGGTAFAVRDLFARLPARKAFLGSALAETRQVTVLVSHYALAYPGIAFEMVAGGRRALTTSGDGNLRHAFAAVYGADTATAMLDVNHEEGGLSVTGLVGPPSVHRGNRSGISVFVNGRWVQSRPLVFAVVDAYQSQMPVGRHPVACLALKLPDDDVDVNVHPAKAEVRFRDERAVSRAVRHAVSAALESSKPVPLVFSGGYTAHGQDGAAPSERPPLSVRLMGGEPAAPVALRQPEPVQGRIEWRGGESAATVGATEARSHRDLLPLLRVVGQMGSTYVVAEAADGMYLVDQHAAHERVIFDRIVAARERPEAVSRQPLLEPSLVELDVHEAATLGVHSADLAALGLELEPFGERACLVRAVPAGIGGTDVATAVRRLLDQLAGERRVADAWGRTAATIACHSSVRAGMAMSTEEMRALLVDLEKTATPRTCPHGRPTLIHVSTDLLERQFGRR